MLRASNRNSTIILIILFSLLSNATIMYAFGGHNSGEYTRPRNIHIVAECFDGRSYDEKEQIELKDGVTREIPTILANQINARKIFENVTLTPLESKHISHEKLDSLREEGIDAIIMGNIFFSHEYHNTNIGRLLLYAVPLGVLSSCILNFTIESSTGYTVFYWYGPGMALGAYLESLHKEHAMELAVKMISTSTYKTIRKDVYEIQLKRLADKKRYAMKKESLQAAIREMVGDISRVSISSQ